VPHGLRFMIDNDMVGMSWITMKAQDYQIRPKDHKRCTTQMEIDVEDYTKVFCHKSCEGPYQKVAPLRILSFDIECLPDCGKFPTPDKDRCI
jgi:DNA polymerase delta subunit 1